MGFAIRECSFAPYPNASASPLDRPEAAGKAIKGDEPTSFGGCLRLGKAGSQEGWLFGPGVKPQAHIEGERALPLRHHTQRIDL